MWTVAGFSLGRIRSVVDAKVRLHIRVYIYKTNLLRVLTWSESRVTLSPSLAMPSSFSSFRCGHRAIQNALATFSVRRLWSAGSLRTLVWSSLWRKNT